MSQSFASYGSVTYWRERGGVSARFRGEWSDCVMWFKTMTEFKRAARPQFRRNMATETTAERYATWSMANS